jgi:hypothetical protein
MSEKIIEIGPVSPEICSLKEKSQSFVVFVKKCIVTVLSSSILGKDINRVIQKTCFKDVMSEKIIEIGADQSEICSLERKISVFRSHS